MSFKTNSTDLQGTLDRLLSLELLRRSVRAEGKLDTAAIIKVLHEKKKSPKHICDTLAADLVEWLTFRHKDPIEHSDRAQQLGWSSKVIHSFALRNLNLYITEMMQLVREEAQKQ